jgi:ATP-dependent Clp protease ATP-binding subunit ClpC
MTEFMEKQSVARLIGAPPGYVGYEEGGKLTEAVRRRPYCLVLFDELEKAHSDVAGILLQIMEEGVLTDSQGRKTDFRSAVLVMTSNLGARRFAQGKKLDFSTGDEARDLEREVIKDAKQAFSPEFFNRLDGALVFHPLSPTAMEDITRRLLEASAERFRKRGIDLVWDEAVVEHLSRQGEDGMGARPLRRLIAAKIEDPAADLMLGGQLAPGQSLRLEQGAEGLSLRILP